MPYAYAAGDYYQAGGLRGNYGNYAAGGLSLKGLVKGIGKVVGGVAKTVGGIVGGIPGQVLQGAGGLIAPAPTPAAFSPIPILPMPMGQVPTPAQQHEGVVRVGVSPLGTVGVAFKKHRHMNAGNAKAARRAIRRIKAVRHLLVGIERELPRRPAVRHHGSPGVITRGEARRALAA